MTEVLQMSGIFFNSCFSEYLKKLKKALINFSSPQTEPKIIRKSDRQGNSYFQVYDPHNRHYATFNSEREIRIWLERSHY
ncbi:MAG: hypothetical protein QNJ38_07230 [Prochloraceae cyanobacterium]|nr:hypothetical protein [Prochloraceae cyanobacterium]